MDKMLGRKLSVMSAETFISDTRKVAKLNFFKQVLRFIYRVRNVANSPVVLDVCVDFSEGLGCPENYTLLTHEYVRVQLQRFSSGEKALRAYSDRALYIQTNLLLSFYRDCSLLLRSPLHGVYVKTRAEIDYDRHRQTSDSCFRGVN
jgi:hypothetical protein